MITVSNIFIKYSDRILLDNVSFVIGERERIGLVGKNGTGKSTILKIIAKYQNPDSGTVTYPSVYTLGFLHQELELPHGKTVIAEALTAFDDIKKLEKRIEEINEEIAQRTDYESDSYSKLLEEFSDANERFGIFGGYNMESEAEQVLRGLGFKPTDMERQTSEFSGGWQMRIELAKIILQRPDYLLLDEPTNHLDIESIIWLENMLRNYEGTVVVISHDKTFLNNVTNRTVEIELGNIYDYKAPYSKYLELRVERRAQQSKEYTNQQREIARKERLIEKYRAKATKAKFAQSLIKELDRMDKIAIDVEDNSAMKLRFLPAPRSGEIVVDAQNVIKQYGELMVLDKIGFQLDRNQRVAFVGRNGEGKSTLSKIIAGVLGSTAGDVKLGHNVAIAYYAQNQADALDPKMTLLQSMEDGCPEELRTKLRTILGSFLFSGEDADKKVSVLSGGERARLALAKMLLRPANLLILDEPTNHLDIVSKDILKKALIAYDGALIVVSHDRDFLQGLTERTIEFRDRKLHEYLGDVQYFLEKRQVDNFRDVSLGKNANGTNSPKTVPSQTNVTELSPEQKKEQHNRKKQLQRDLHNAERKVEKLEKKIVEYEAKMAESGFYESEKSQETLQAYQKTQEDLEAAMGHWETTQEEFDSL